MKFMVDYGLKVSPQCEATATERSYMQLMGGGPGTLLITSHSRAGAFGTATERDGDNWGRAPRGAASIEGLMSL